MRYTPITIYPIGTSIIDNPLANKFLPDYCEAVFIFRSILNLKYKPYHEEKYHVKGCKNIGVRGGLKYNRCANRCPRKYNQHSYCNERIDQSCRKRNLRGFSL